MANHIIRNTNPDIGYYTGTGWDKNQQSAQQYPAKEVADAVIRAFHMDATSQENTPAGQSPPAPAGQQTSAQQTQAQTGGQTQQPGQQQPQQSGEPTQPQQSSGSNDVSRFVQSATSVLNSLAAWIDRQ